jgi:ATP-dependent Clp protease ATP-binding subunit ClpA
MDVLRAEIAPPSSTPIPTSVSIVLSERTKHVFNGGAAEADRLQHAEIGLAHLLLGVLREPGSLAVMLLDRHGVRASAIRDQLPILLRDELG